MEIWLRVIVEWIKCLGLVLGSPAKDLKEVEDGEFYRKLIRMSWKGSNDVADKDDIVQEFLKDVYPDYKSAEGPDDKEQVYLASLFLLYTSQEPVFQKPMCYKLGHDTQIKIKTFLEMILPHGKGITREIVKGAVTEMSGCSVHTPITPKAESLKEFFDSPVARSAQRDKTVMEKNRELRKLRNELEVERFEKLDLQEDLKIQQAKINNLHRKLEEKTAEIKALKEEQMRPLTPQSCKKENDRFHEHYLRKEIDRLENQVMEKQIETERLEADNGALSKRVAYTEKQYSVLREQCELYEKSLESLQVQAELKDRELANLKAANQELRTYLRELSKPSFGNQSFEGDEVSAALSPLNSSEPLSAVIEIQLQEAKEESTLLKSQLDALNKRMENTTKELEEKNGELLEKGSRLEEVQAELSVALGKLSCSNERAETLREEKADLEKSMADLRAQKESEVKDIERRLTEESKTRLENTEREWRVKHESLQDRFKAEQDIRGDLEEKLQDLQNRLSESESLNSDLANDLATTRGRVKDLQEVIEAGKRKSEEMTLEENRLKEEARTMEKALKSVQDENMSLEKTLEEERLALNNLQEELDRGRIVSRDLEEEVRNVKEENVALEKDKSEMLSRLESLQEMANVAKEEARKLSDRLDLKDQELTDLTDQNARVRADYERIVALRKESESRERVLTEELLERRRDLDKLMQEAKLTEENLSSTQAKYQQYTKEACTTETRMREVIANLQEVRATQEAVMTAQELAMKEKTLYAEDLLKQFEELKLKYSKELENEKALSRKLQCKWSELQIQSYKQTRTIEELEETLRRERSTLDEVREHLRTEDTSRSKIVNVCEQLQASVNGLKTVKDRIPEVNESRTISQDHDDEDEVVKILWSAINEVQATGRLVQDLFDENVRLGEVDDRLKLSHQEADLLKKRVQDLEEAQTMTNKRLLDLIDRKCSLRDSIEGLIKSRKNLGKSVENVETRWGELLVENKDVLRMTESSGCQEANELRARMANLEDSLRGKRISYLEGERTLSGILWREFLWTKESLEESKKNLDYTEKTLESKKSLEDSAKSLESTNNLENESKKSLEEESEVINPQSKLPCGEAESIEDQLGLNKVLEEDLTRLQREIQDFSDFVDSFARSLRSDERILWSDSERILRAEIQEMTEERNEATTKLGLVRLRNTKLEDQLDQLTKECDGLKVSLEELGKDARYLKEENSRLTEERDQLSKRPRQEDVDARLQEAHARYKTQLEESKQKMTVICNEQIARLSKEQERCIKEMESLQGRMKEQCIKQAEEINSYKSHVSNLTSQFWNVAEKLLTEQQRTAELKKELDELKARLQGTKLQIGQQQQQTTSISTIGHQRSIKSEKVEGKEDVFQKVSMIKEKTTYERIVKMVGGNAFNAEDEEGEVFDNIYLADMKKGPSPGAANADRLFELKMRNSLCKPHLKTSYPAELQFNPLPFTEEEIKAGTVQEDVFNDSLSQSLLPDQKPKKRDRTQTSYKKPGPPTPSKNGGRLSLLGNELRSPNSRILRDRNKDRATATPTAFAKLFRRCDENNAATPKERRKSLGLRRSRLTSNR